MTTCRENRIRILPRRRDNTCLLLLLVLLAISIQMSFAFQTPCSCLRRSVTIGLVHKTKGTSATATRLFGAAPKSNAAQDSAAAPLVSLYRSEGIFCVNKPLGWTSNNVVSYIRGILERDARERGAKPVKVTSRRNKSRILRVGHGGTLDPLASGVLVIGVGKGTKELQSYLSGSKKYKATGEFGFETTTLDLDEAGEVTKRMPYNHVTIDALQDSLSDFKGTIMQVPPIFSAIRKEGKKMYEQAREGKTAEELKLEPRQVEVYNLELVTDNDDLQLPSFELNIECGGGTYVRSLIRDIGYKLDTVATMTALERTQQGQFTSGDALEKEDWCPDNIYGAIDKVNASRENL